VLTATEFITDSTVITPTGTPTQPSHQNTPQGLSGLNPALLQELLQKQLNNFQIQPTPMEEFHSTPTATPTVVTLFVSGKNPGEFSTVLSTLNVPDGRKKRQVQPSPAEWTKIKGTMGGLEGLSARGQVELDDSYSYTEGTFPASLSQNYQDTPQPIRTLSLDSQNVPWA